MLGSHYREGKAIDAVYLGRRLESEGDSSKQQRLLLSRTPSTRQSPSAGFPLHRRQLSNPASVPYLAEIDGILHERLGTNSL